MSRFGAIAVGHRWANAVGPVEICCEPLGLRIDLHGVRRHALGFAPVGEAQRTTLRAPYAAVRGLVREGPLLLLALDPRVIAPYNRFALARFRRHADSSLVRAFRLRSAAAVASVIAPPLAAAAALAIPRGLTGGPGGVALAAVVFATLAFVLFRRLAGWLSWGGPLSDRLRDDLEQRLGERLGLEAAPALLTDPVAPATVPAAFGTVSRPRRLAAALVVALAGASATAFVVKRYGALAVVRLPVDRARTGITAPVLPLLAAARRASTASREQCSCARADSPLWQVPIPRLSVLASPRRGTLGSSWLVPDRVYPIAIGDKEIAELDVAVVNNGSQPIATVSVVVTFWLRALGQRTHISERGLYWPNPLNPGESVKWRIHARGTELRVTSYVPGTIEPGAAAPADAFARLARANLASVRLHGAMMLAWLGDPRAPEAARALDRLAPVEQSAQGEIIAAVAPLIACDASGEPLTACVMNRSDRVAKSFLVREPDREQRIDDLLFPGHGLRVAVSSSTGLRISR